MSASLPFEPIEGSPSLHCAECGEGEVFPLAFYPQGPPAVDYVAFQAKHAGHQVIITAPAPAA